jgi:hypothetical protein
MEKKVLKLEDVVKGIRPIVETNPTFIYPQQEDHNEDERCSCVEVEQDEDTDYYEEHYLYDECEWHLDDDNTCRYVKKDESPACVVGHYFIKELGFGDLYNFETKAPTFILEAHGYEVEAPAQRFLNTIQSQQDQGWDWDTAYNQAFREVGKYFAEAEVPYAEE